MENKIEDIGTLLREQRERLGYSLKDAAQHTRIRQALLESIEHNRFSELPGQAYVTGFIRVYAHYLGLDSDALLENLDDLPIGTGTSSVKYVPVAKHKPSRSRKPAAKQGRGTLIVGLLAILLVGGVVYFVPGLFRDKPPVVELAPRQVEPEQEPAPVPAEPVPVPAEPVANSVNAAVDARPLDRPEEEGSAKAEKDEALHLKEETPVQVSDVTAAVVPKRFPAVAENGSSLRMLALNKSTLVIYVDGRSPHKYRLHDGLDLTWKIKKKVKVELADVGAARFWLDGQELDLGELPAFQLQTDSGE